MCFALSVNGQGDENAQLKGFFIHKSWASKSRIKIDRGELTSNFFIKKGGDPAKFSSLPDLPLYLLVFFFRICR